MSTPLHTTVAFQMTASAPAEGQTPPSFAMIDPTRGAAALLPQQQQQQAALYNPFLGQLQTQTAGQRGAQQQHFIFGGTPAAPATGTFGVPESVQEQPQQPQPIPPLPPSQPPQQPVYFGQQPTVAQVAATGATTAAMSQNPFLQPMLMAMQEATAALQQATQPMLPQPQQYLTTGATGAPVPLPPNTMPVVVPPNVYRGESAMGQMQQQRQTVPPGAAQSAPVPAAIAASAPPKRDGPEVTSDTSQKEGGRKRASPTVVEANGPDPPAPRRHKKHHHHHRGRATDPSAETESAAVVSISASSADAAVAVASSSTNSDPRVSAAVPIKAEKAPSATAPPKDSDDLPPPTIDKAAYALMSPDEKRRHDRNIREQQRSYKIGQQIKELRTVLMQSNIPFKPNKFSILLTVVEYIKQLQSRALLLDAEHRKLITTIRQTSEMVNSGRTPPNGTVAAGGAAAVHAGSETTTNVAGRNIGGHTMTTSASAAARRPIGNDADLLFVHGLDYNAVFDQCPAALGVAALDGRFLACNCEFELTSGYSRAELSRQSLFNFLTGKELEEFFGFIGEMLKIDTPASSARQKEGNSNSCGGDGTVVSGKVYGMGSGKPLTHWSGVVSQKDQNVQLRMNVTLTRTAEGKPKFFNCGLTTAG